MTETRFYLVDGGFGGQIVVEFKNEQPVRWGEDIDGLAEMRTDNLDRVAEEIHSGRWTLFA